VTSVGLCSTSDITTFHQNWHHLHSSSVGGKDLSSDTQIRVIGSNEIVIFSKMLRNLTEDLEAKFPSTTLGHSTVRIAHLGDAFCVILELEASLEEGQSLQQKDKKRRKRNVEKKTERKKLKALGHSQNFYFCVCPSKNVIKPPGEGLLPLKLGGGVRPSSPNPFTLFLTKINDFPHPIYDLTKNLNFLFMTVTASAVALT